MSSAQIRQRLYEYIRFANEKKVKALYTMLEEEIEEKHEIWTKAFTAEMQHRTKEMESGKVKGKTRSDVSRKAYAIVKR
jgi:hypothetical protein